MFTLHFLFWNWVTQVPVSHPSPTRQLKHYTHEEVFIYAIPSSKLTLWGEKFHANKIISKTNIIFLSFIGILCLDCNVIWKWKKYCKLSRNCLETDIKRQDMGFSLFLFYHLWCISLSMSNKTVFVPIYSIRFMHLSLFFYFCEIAKNIHYTRSKSFYQHQYSIIQFWWEKQKAHNIITIKNVFA